LNGSLIPEPEPKENQVLAVRRGYGSGPWSWTDKRGGIGGGLYCAIASTGGALDPGIRSKQVNESDSPVP
jgi:hypothetical protein